VEYKIDIGTIIFILLFVIIVLLIFRSIIIIRPTEKGVVERLGKFNKVIEQGMHIMIPIVDHVRIVNMTEKMVIVEPQEVITKDKLNTLIDAVVYYKVLDPQATLYNVNDHESQTVMLAKTSLRSVIGNLSLTETTENRARINLDLQNILSIETKTYGIDVLRCELQEIKPPKNVQEAMNEVVRTENLKLSAVNEAIAVETKANGLKMASIKEAEGKKTSVELEAEGEANAVKTLAQAEADKIKLVNESIQENFKDAAVEYKKLETVLESLKNGTKIIVGTESSLVNVIGDIAGITPIEKK
jgi:regulator of protease activity HflC (stomatin/prohibitin superfamily)